MWSDFEKSASEDREHSLAKYRILEDAGLWQQKERVSFLQLTESELMHQTFWCRPAYQLVEPMIWVTTTRGGSELGDGRPQEKMSCGVWLGGV
jgi:hypothetical protein